MTSRSWLFKHQCFKLLASWLYFPSSYLCQCSTVQLKGAVTVASGLNAVRVLGWVGNHWWQKKIRPKASVSEMDWSKNGRLWHWDIYVHAWLQLFESLFWKTCRMSQLKCPSCYHHRAFWQCSCVPCPPCWYCRMNSSDSAALKGLLTGWMTERRKSGKTDTRGSQSSENQFSTILWALTE